MPNEIDARMEAAGLVDILRLDPSIKTDVRYATDNNFTGKVLYTEPFGLFAEPMLAKRIARANSNLKKLHPGYSIVIFDAARPLSVQKTMYDMVKGTPQEPYIANPYSGDGAGFHNYGMAVDLSIADERGEPLDMGTDFDAFTDLAHPGGERDHYLQNRISREAYANRMLLFALMGREGLVPHEYEWWHFQYYQRNEDKSRFALLDF